MTVTGIFRDTRLQPEKFGLPTLMAKTICAGTRQILIVGLAIVGLLTLSACGTPMNHEVAQRIHTIALIPANNPEIIEAKPFQVTPSTMYGAVGFAISSALASGNGASDATTLSARVAEQNVRLGDDITREVEAMLTQAGYKVIRLARNQAKGAALLSNYKDMVVAADAVLDINIVTAGYVQVGALDRLYPNLVLVARLVDASTKQELYWNFFTYGGMSGVLRPDRLVKADLKYAMSSIADIRKSPDLAIEGLRAGIAPLVSLLKAGLGK